MYRPRSWLLLAAGVLLSAELAVRALGMVDFPIYEADAVIGYVPAGNQQGRFLNKNAWQFNALHMGAPEFRPGPKLDVLVVGDSVVYGGNSFHQSDRLGPALQAATNDQVAAWPISAGSWALRNELTWLRQNPLVPAEVDRVVFVLNRGDFGEASSWKCETQHPTAKPTVATWYLFNKHIHAFESCLEVPASLQVPVGDVAVELKAFLTAHGNKTLFALYPDRDDADDPTRAATAFAAGRALLVAAGARVIADVASDPRWSSRLYRDGIHPSAEGNRVLAEIIGDRLETNKALLRAERGRGVD